MYRYIFVLTVSLVVISTFAVTPELTLDLIQCLKGSKMSVKNVKSALETRDFDRKEVHCYFACLHKKFGTVDKDGLLIPSAFATHLIGDKKDKTRAMIIDAAKYCNKKEGCRSINGKNGQPPLRLVIIFNSLPEASACVYKSETLIVNKYRSFNIFHRNNVCTFCHHRSMKMYKN